MAGVEAAQVRNHVQREAQALLQARQNDRDDHVLELSDIVEADQQSIDRVTGASRGNWTRSPSSVWIELGQAVRLGGSLKRFGDTAQRSLLSLIEHDHLSAGACIFPISQRVALAEFGIDEKNPNLTRAFAEIDGLGIRDHHRWMAAPGIGVDFVPERAASGLSERMRDRNTHGRYVVHRRWHVLVVRENDRALC